MAKILLLGSGELGKEFVISLKRLGCEVVACDSYNNAPAQQVADKRETINMLDGKEVRRIIDLHTPDFVVPEIEAIRTEALIKAEDDGYRVIPSARAVNLTMNRDHIRDRAVEIGLKTAKYAYAETLQEMTSESEAIGLPVIVKPVMSSSGKGQSTVKSSEDLVAAWDYAVTGMRGDRKRVIVEEFIEFDYEITLLTVKQWDQPTVFCKPIGHVQARGDYQYSWQPCDMSTKAEKLAQDMAKLITDDLGGAGIFGVEFFVKNNDVIFSELSPRPHDTGMVTMCTQTLNEFDLHARAILGYPIPSNVFKEPGASHVILANKEATDYQITGMKEAMEYSGVDVRIFGKPSTRKNRRMGVILAPDLKTAKLAASKISII
jgi:phosphoribosylglycinamide formyltransferase 2